MIVMIIFYFMLICLGKIHHLVDSEKLINNRFILLLQKSQYKSNALHFYGEFLSHGLFFIIQLRV